MEPAIFNFPNIAGYTLSGNCATFVIHVENVGGAHTGCVVAPIAAELHITFEPRPKRKFREIALQT